MWCSDAARDAPLNGKPAANATKHSLAIMKKPDLLIDDLRVVLEATSPTSKLGQWLTANQVEFEQLLTTHRPRWEVLATKFAEEGLISVPTTFWGKADSPERKLARKRAGEAARQVWQRVKRKPARVSLTTMRPRTPGGSGKAGRAK